MTKDNNIESIQQKSANESKSKKYCKDKEKIFNGYYLLIYMIFLRTLLRSMYFTNIRYF